MGRYFKTLALMCTLLCTSIAALAQRGEVRDDYTIQSKILGKSVSYTVYLPASYSTDSRSYPVLYLLHGAGGNHASWIEDGELCRIASETIASGTAPEMIIVSPQGFMHAYVNAFDGSADYEDFFIKELIPEVEKNFRVMARRNKRAIAGLSMGGYGTLYHALVHKDVFGACYAMSAVSNNFTHTVEEGRTVTEEEQAYIDSHDIVKIIENMDDERPQDFHRLRRRRLPAPFQFRDGQGPPCA